MASLLFLSAVATFSLQLTVMEKRSLLTQSSAYTNARLFAEMLFLSLLPSKTLTQSPTLMPLRTAWPPALLTRISLSAHDAHVAGGVEA